MPSRDPVKRRLDARRAALTRWSRSDPREGTAAARARFQDGFIDLVDPDHKLRQSDPAEAERRAAAARKAHYTRMAALSYESRRALKGLTA